MKTKLLPLVAIISMAAFAPANAGPISSNGSKAYAVDNSGNVVRDSYGACVRSSSWTKEAAIAACETPASATAKAATKESKSATKAKKAAPVAAAATTKIDYSDIQGNDQFAYAVDSNGRIIRDGYGGCVRTIDWSKETAIAKCEGWEEAKPVVVAPPAAKPVAAAPAPVAKVISVDVPASFTGFFDFDKADLKPNAKEELDAYSDYMQADETKKIKVTGHTDTTGPAEYNQGLSERRAAAAKTYLEEKGIDGQRIETLGKGETSPAASNATREGRAENRRIEIEVIK